MSILDDCIRETIQQIEDEEIKDYLNKPIPCEVDERVRALVELFISASMEERKLMFSLITRRISGVLLAERMAAAGVRENSRRHLLQGLIALLIENYTIDWRDTVTCMAPLYHASGRIGGDVQELFDEAASYADNEVAGNLAAFPRRKAEDRSLETFGYKEVLEPDGTRYRCL
jgi:hypothetical protein